MKILFFSISTFLLLWGLNIDSPKTETSQAVKTPLEAIWSNDFIGSWINKDDQTRGITKFNIKYDKNRFNVEVWGACHPKDCKWEDGNSDEVEEETNRFDVFWDQGFVERNFTFEIIDNRLKLTHRSKYKDKSGRADSELIEYFVKQ